MAIVLVNGPAQDVAAQCETTAHLLGATAGPHKSFHCPELMTFFTACGVGLASDIDAELPSRGHDAEDDVDAAHASCAEAMGAPADCLRSAYEGGGRVDVACSAPIMTTPWIFRICHRSRAFGIASAAMMIVVVGCTEDNGANIVTDAGAGTDTPPISLYDASPVDGPLPDGCAVAECGGHCVDTNSDPDHCGACDQACLICSEATCECPGDFVPEPFDIESSFVFGNNPPALAAVGTFIGSDGLDHSVAIRFHLENTPVDAAIDLAAKDASVRVSFRYDRDGMMSRARFAVTSGSVTFTRICAEGVTGTMTELTLAESVGGDMPGLVSDGCTGTLAMTTFDLGEPCGVPDDAGASVLDAGSAVMDAAFAADALASDRDAGV